MLRILQRLILWELLKVFLLSMTGLTGLLLMAGLVVEASRHGLSPDQIAGVIPLLLPSLLPYTLPTTTLFAACVVYGRLAADNEILALRSAGVHIMKIVWPVIFLGIFLSGLTFVLYLDLIPGTQHRLRSKVLNDIEGFMYTMLERKGYIAHPNLNYEIFVKSVKGRKLIDAEFLRRDANGQFFDIVARAKRAELRVELQQKRVLVLMEDCHVSAPGGSVLFFKFKTWPVELPKEFSEPEKSRASHLTWMELDDEVVRTEEKIREIDGKIAAHQAIVNLGAAPDNYPEHIQNLRRIRQHYESQIVSIDVEKHMRPSVAIGCICFVLVGCPVGIWFSRSDYLSTFMICFLPIVLIYYPLMLCGVNMAKTNNMHIIPAIWSANAFLGILSLFMFRKLLKN